jgi:hypothetical protein
MKAHGMHLRY